MQSCYLTTMSLIVVKTQSVEKVALEIASMLCYAMRAYYDDQGWMALTTKKPAADSRS